LILGSYRKMKFSQSQKFHSSKVSIYSPYSLFIQVKAVMTELKTNKKIASAAHNILAYRYTYIIYRHPNLLLIPYTEREIFVGSNFRGWPVFNV
jgi:hypothetical protein